MTAASSTPNQVIFDPHNVSIPRDKIRKYLLDPLHAEGGPKAKFFLAFGISAKEWQALEHALRAHPVENAVDHQEVTEYGVKFMVRCALRTPDGRNPCLLTIWMVDGPGAARFVTAVPDKRSKTREASAD